MKSKLVLIVVVAFLAWCGGGVGGSDGEPNFAGVWDATVSLTKDGCNLAAELPSAMTDVLTINQDGAEITLTDSEGKTSPGVIDGSDSFSVKDEAFQFNSRCTGIETTKFSALSDISASVSFVFDLDCGRSLTCSVEY